MFVLERSWTLLFILLVPAWFILRRLFAPAFFPRLSLVDSEGNRAPGEYALAAVARRLREFLAVLAFISTAVAASGPSLVQQELLFFDRGDEVIFVIDVSPSMAAEDFHPDRLSAARSLIDRFLATRRNEAVGLVAFGGEAALLCPPTLDYSTLQERLAALKPGMLGDGTALGAGIAVAASHGLSAAVKARHIVVLTDGENNAGALAPASAAALAKESGFDLSVVGVGRKGSVPLSYVDPATGERRTGTYESAFSRSALEDIARKGGGGYYDASDVASLELAFDSISAGSTSLTRTRSVNTGLPLAPLLVGLSLGLLTLARILGLAFGEGLP
ncbi:MAG TPA: VWA domain-containing protein [Rectinemataceae bacterium]|nr:VWA domain-containing protein [Rectinemataceae bacterium]